MNRKQKEELQLLLKARRRADRVLAKRRQAEQEKLAHKMRREASQELMQKYTRELTALAQKSGILGLAETAALQLGASLTQEVSYHVYYGMATSSLQQTFEIAERGELRASYLALRILWGQPEALKEAEIRVYPKGRITFHNSLLPVFPFFWRHNPQILQKMLASALEHPHPPSAPLQTGA